MTTVSVVVCAYTLDRWNDIAAAVAALKSQVQPGDQILVVIDHNDQLFAKAQAEFSGVDVITNQNARGLSGARNTGVEAATGDVVLFLDDDALPLPGWVYGYRARFEQNSRIVAVGGAVEPNWEGGSKPTWFPAEFGWVVGCDYRGLPDNGSAIRNPIGASMGIRRDALDRVGSFSERVGRVGSLPVGCEETELCIRLRQQDSTALIVRDTSTTVEHRVPAARQRPKYFFSRCYHEGRSKAALTAIVGSQDGLSAERSYATKILVSGVCNYVKEAANGDVKAVGRASFLVAGFVATTIGFVGKMISGRARSISSSAPNR